MSALLKPLPWWGRWLVLVGVAAVAFSAGAFLKPAEIVQTSHVEFRVRWKEKIITQVKVEQAKARVVYVDRVIYPDGKVEEKSKTVEQESVKADSSSLVDRSGESQGKEIQTLTTKAQPRFRLHLLAGGALVRPWLTLTGPLVLGLQFDFRLFGGVSLGLWLNTVGAGGLALSLDLP